MQRLHLIDEYKKIVSSEFHNKLYDDPLMGGTTTLLREIPCDCQEDINTLRDKLKVMKDITPAPSDPLKLSDVNEDDEVKEYLSVSFNKT